MPYEMIEKQYRTLTLEQQNFVFMMINSLCNLNKSEASKKNKTPVSGLAKGLFKYPDDINLYDDEIAEMFGV